MFTPPAGWTRSAGDQLLVLRPPGGNGRVRVHALLAPRPFADTVELLLGADPGFVAGPRGRPLQLVTREGEYGAWLELAGTQAGQPARRFIAAIFVDTFVAALDGLSLDPSADPAIAGGTRALFDGASFGGGPRRRRFVYRRPAGWHALAQGLLATWYPPDYPRHRAQLVVHPAEPSERSAERVFAELLADEERRGFTRSGPATVHAVSSHVFSGAHATVAGCWRGDPTALHREVVILCDGRYRYVLRLESTAEGRRDEDRELFVATARSVEPLPHAGLGRRGSPIGPLTDLGGPWAE